MRSLFRNRHLHYKKWLGFANRGEARFFILLQCVVMGALLQTEAKPAVRDVQPKVPTLAEGTSRQRAIEALNCLIVDRLPVWPPSSKVPRFQKAILLPAAGSKAGTG